MHAIAVGPADPGHVFIDFHDDDTGPFHNGHGIRHLGADVEMAMFVHRGDLQHGDIDLRVLAPVFQLFPVLHGDVPAVAFLVHLPFDGAELAGLPPAMFGMGVRLDDGGFMIVRPDAGNSF